MEKTNENKKEPLPCIICGRVDRFRLVMCNTLMPDVPPYVICLECAGEAKEERIKDAKQ